MQSVPKPATSDNGFVHQKPQSDYDAVTPQPETPRWMHREPPFLHSVKWHDKDLGIEHLTVIRATDIDDMWHKVRQVVALVRTKRHAMEPVPGQSNGKPTDDWCPIHGVAMNRFEKNGQAWWSHKTADGSWCKGQ